jgi:hypothetical protein
VRPCLPLGLAARKCRCQSALLRQLRLQRRHPATTVLTKHTVPDSQRLTTTSHLAEMGLDPILHCSLAYCIAALRTALQHSSLLPLRDANSPSNHREIHILFYLNYSVTNSVIYIKYSGYFYKIN